MSQLQRTASDLHGRGFNCAQSIFAAFSDQCGVSTELALRLAAPFGGGLARKGQVCGALSGALMVLGVQNGSEQPGGKEAMYGLAREFIEQFEQQNGSIVCKELLGHDISTPEGLQAAKDHNAFAAVCPALIDQTAQELAKYLNDHPPQQV